MNTSSHGPNAATGKRKRGRKPGSKNKPKFPVPTPDAATFQTHVLEVPGGGDVAETIASFVRGCRPFGVCVLSASGSIGSAVLWEASSYRSTLAFQGCFDILSMTATFLPGGTEGSLALTLAGFQGQVVGGMVAGAVVAAGTVIVVAATFVSPMIHRCDEIINCTVSTSPASIGVEEEGRTGRVDGVLMSGEGAENQESERDRIERQINEVGEILDLPEVVDGVFIGGEEVDQNALEQYVKELEQCFELPSAAVSESSGECITGEKESLDSASVLVESDDGNVFEQLSGLRVEVDCVLGSDCDGCGEHFAFDGLWASPPRLPFY